MSEQIDLHMHTDHSDGSCTAVELLRLVRKKKLSAFAITDHDTLGGYDAVKPLLEENDPELVSGVELSAVVNGDDLHMLAYLFDPDHEGMRKALSQFRVWRVERGKQIVEKLCQMGLSITYEDVEKTVTGDAVGRPHIAETLFRLGITNSYVEGFHKYLAYGGPAYLPKTSVTPVEAIRLVHDAGGVAVIAHPGIADMYKHINELASAGLDGVEVYHYAHSESKKKELIKLAEQNNLVVTGGSDFHGGNKRNIDIGSQRVPLSCLEKLKERVSNRT